MTSINNNYLINNNLSTPLVPTYKLNGTQAQKLFENNSNKVSFTSLVETIGSPRELEAYAKSNPRIRMLAEKYDIPIKVDAKAYEDLKKGHLKDCRVVAAQIASNLPKELKSQVDLPALQEAAMYHDLGKVLIPHSILNKNTSLSEKEWEIMELHSEFGYELAKSKNLSPKTLNLIKYHHQNKEGTGYPAAGSDFSYDINNEILEAADRHCALREKRSYKGALSKEETLKIMKDDLSPEVYEALCKAAEVSV